jgi:ActR/RegA family two-component response regulator
MSQKATPSILVVEDDLDLRQTIVESLESNGLSATQAAGAADAIERLRSGSYDGLVVDLRLPDADGMTVLDEALDRYPEIRAVVMTGFGGVAQAAAAIKRGAVDSLIKPFQLSQLPRVLHASLEQQRLREENAELKAQLKGKFRFENIIGKHGTMQALLTTIELVSPMNSTVLIHGETGTGKELVARTIHHTSSCTKMLTAQPRIPNRNFSAKIPTTAKMANPIKLRILFSSKEVGLPALRADVSKSFVGSLIDYQHRSYSHRRRSDRGRVCPGAGSGGPTGAPAGTGGGHGRVLAGGGGHAGPPDRGGPGGSSL